MAQEKKYFLFSMSSGASGKNTSTWEVTGGCAGRRCRWVGGWPHTWSELCCHHLSFLFSSGACRPPTSHFLWLVQCYALYCSHSVYFLRISGFFSRVGFPSGELVLMEFPQRSSSASAHGDPNHSSMVAPFSIPEPQKASKQVVCGMAGSQADLLIKNNFAANIEIMIALHPGCAAHSGPLHQALVDLK